MTVEFRKEKTLEVALRQWIKKIKALRGAYTDNQAKLAEFIKGELPKLLDAAESIPAENTVNLETLKGLRDKHASIFDDSQTLLESMSEQLRNLILLAEDINGMEFKSDIPTSLRNQLLEEEILLEKCDGALIDLSKTLPLYLSDAQNDIKETIKNSTLLAFANFQDGILETEKTLDSLFSILRENLQLAKDLERSRIS
ncbi:hypothetical protein [Candidatus Borrarchaeum sp.]|uniref:hypothetical protein n=1 Tax=Candidatus Borrarchaeum sp. TaxID=2846742 RepID=UPI0025798900|nr:hypothetical protein [Candidatus Borrarchaeum sp.]